MGDFLNFILLLAPGMLVVGWQFAERKQNVDKIHDLHMGVIKFSHDMFEIVKNQEARIRLLEDELTRTR